VTLNSRALAELTLAILDNRFAVGKLVLTVLQGSSANPEYTKTLGKTRILMLRFRAEYLSIGSK
jgi:hypothetical protein